MWWRIVILIVVFGLAITWLAFLVSIAPKLSKRTPTGELETPTANDHLKFPANLEDLKNLADLLKSFLNDSWEYVVILFSSAYLFKQTFAIPGSVFLNVLAGAVFGLRTGFAFCSLLTAIGATLCFFLARICGQTVALRYFPKHIHSFKEKLDDNRNRLPWFLLFLRLFPMSPNWALNMSCGVLEVPIGIFFLTVFVGLMPYNYICVQTGVLLTSLTSMEDIFTLSTMLQMSGVALVALLPGFLIRNKKAALP